MRLDLGKLTVVADTEDGPYPMSKMGSAETWVSVHLITHLALHNWFVKKSCPVPQFLFLDQPSQAYFPPDTSAEIVKGVTIAQDVSTATNNSDRDAVIRMFKMIVAEAKGFQVIITEHAFFDEDWYRNLIRENWWDDKIRLVPLDWISETSSLQ